MTDKVTFTGTLISVKARIRLLRSFDQIPTQQYQGYTLILDGEVGGEPRPQFKVAIGPKVHEEHQFRIGNRVSGMAVPVSDTEAEWASSKRPYILILQSFYYDGIHTNNL